VLLGADRHGGRISPRHGRPLFAAREWQTNLDICLEFQPLTKLHHLGQCRLDSWRYLAVRLGVGSHAANGIHEGMQQTLLILSFTIPKKYFRTKEILQASQLPQASSYCQQLWIGSHDQRAPRPPGVVNGVLYAVSGNSGTVLATVVAYDPVTNSWTTEAAMPTGRANLAPGVVNAVLYAVGGPRYRRSLRPIREPSSWAQT
jgi:hypothetical protein